MTNSNWLGGVAHPLTSRTLSVAFPQLVEQLDCENCLHKKSTCCVAVILPLTFENTSDVLQMMTRLSEKHLLSFEKMIGQKVIRLMPVQLRQVTPQTHPLKPFFHRKSAQKSWL